jgi:hypothetical protein
MCLGPLVDRSDTRSQFIIYAAVESVSPSICQSKITTKLQLFRLQVNIIFLSGATARATMPLISAARLGRKCEDRIYLHYALSSYYHTHISSRKKYVRISMTH